MRTAKPNAGEEWCGLRRVLFNELEGLRDNCIRAVAGDFHRFAVAAEGPVGFEIVGNREPFVEPEVAGMQRVAGGQRPARAGLATAQVPFPEVPGAIADGLDRLRDGHFLLAQRHSRPEHPAAVRVAPGHHARPRRRATRMRRIEPVEAQAGGCHGVEVGRPDRLESVVTDVAPALVIRHAEDDVGLARSAGCRCRRLGPDQSDH